MNDRELIEQWIKPGAIVPVNNDAVAILVKALRDRLAQPEPEPVAWNGKCVLGHCGSPSGCDDSGCCRAAPPKREWVGLTDEERKAFSYFVNWEMLDQIEAKLKEKNT